MKTILKSGLLILSLLIVGTVSAQKTKKSKKSKKSKTEQVEKMELNMNDTMTKVSYALGMNIVANLKQQGLDTLDEAAFSEGLKAALAGDSTLVSEEESNQILQAYFASLQEGKSKMASKEGELFLAGNASKEGVIVTASGLQYEVMTAGEGAKPLATDQVTVHYTGTTIAGKVFDSSVERGTPATFGLNQVIAGWTEGVQLMSVGAKYKFYIPYNLAYGERGAGADIAPYAALIFEVELIKIN
ncbi:MAG: FKBP-type peptidyl-prolyl cis-trans isomerase FklB [Salibacteraceae bacterium]|jgi:FKBP-type peptidyl-prolyl cis-trans isomerase FklB